MATVPNIPVSPLTQTSPFWVDLVDDAERPIRITTLAKILTPEIQNDLDLISAEQFANRVLNYVQAERQARRIDAAACVRLGHHDLSARHAASECNSNDSQSTQTS